VLAHHADLLVLDEPTPGWMWAGGGVPAGCKKTNSARGCGGSGYPRHQEEAQLCNQVMLLPGGWWAGRAGQGYHLGSPPGNFRIVIGADRKLTVLECGHGTMAGRGTLPGKYGY